MIETWHFSGVPKRVEVLGRDVRARDERQGYELVHYWLKGFYPWWGKVIPAHKTWSGSAETFIKKIWRWPTDSNGLEEPTSRIIRD